ncbi:FosX/FosE/FosI family fosfomycin resistance hydrolase [Listeria kieliensis]|uniref:VOC domain-containing protein n=1 Tax=Listeria kieliensis TaxID=1621700 RepID=A0A3D8TSS7_9LIST|nr:FosX/FosE/FosI family fosfomycin resistance hydrolase [Listeria kieliensis]RDX01990.1 hypothetical protein UR08_00080 [Listeria kieliensis]
MIEGISHVTFIVKNLEKTKHMLEYIFQAKEIYSSDGKNFSISNEKFFIVSNIWIAIMENKNESLNRTYNHIAFKIRDDDFENYIKKIKHLGLEIKSSRTRISGEGVSIYFYDYDNHLFELHTGTLGERLETYKNSMQSKLIS